MFPAAIPSAAPDTIPIVVFMISIATTADSAATPSPPTRPIAAPIANSNGRLLNITCPACSISVNCNLFPKARNSPAAGNIATGVINAFPIFCTSAKIFIFPPVFLPVFIYSL